MIKNKLFNRKNKRGFIGDLLVLIVLALGIIIILGLIFYFWIKFNGMMNSFKGPLDAAIPSNSANLNGTSIIDSTMGKANAAWGLMPYISAAMLFSLIILTFVTAYYSRNHPLVIVVYFIVTIIFIALSMLISNIYNNFFNSLTDPDMINAFTSQLYAHYFLLYLPYFTTIIGVFGLGLSIISSGREE
jgi:hypothetical protein